MKKTEKIKLKEIEIDEFSREREMQKIIEGNLQEIFGLDFLCSEFKFGPPNEPDQNRIDILAFDSTLKSFVIIECKNKATSGAIEQGKRYFNLMKNQYREQFYGEYQEYQDKVKAAAYHIRSVKWKKSRLIFVTTGYTRDQKIAVDDDPQIELWKIKRYVNNIIFFNRVDKAASELNRADKIASEHMFAVSSEDDGPTDEYDPIEKRKLAEATEEMGELVNLYKKFRSGILGLGLSNEIKVKGRESYLGFDVGAKNIVGIQINITQLNMWINMSKGELDDPKKLTEYSGKNHNGNGDYRIIIRSDDLKYYLDHFDYILGLIKQSLRYHSNDKKADSQNKDLFQKTTNRQPKINRQRKKIKRTEEDHFEGRTEDLVDLYGEFKTRILNLSGAIKIKVRGTYIGFDTYADVPPVNIASIEFYATQLAMWINMPKGTLTGSMKITRDVYEVKHHGQGDYQINIDSHENLEHILDLIKQSLEYEGKRTTGKKRRR